MEHTRKQKLFVVLALVVAIASLSVGFAAFSVSLNISSQAIVSPSSDAFSVKFSSAQNSVVVEEIVPSSISDGVNATNGVIDNSVNPTIKNLSAIFSEPGQFVEYTFYVRNNGAYDAYLNSVNYLGDMICKAETGTSESLVQSACESISITVRVGATVYKETTPVSGVKMTAGRSWMTVKIKLSYEQGGTSADGAFSIEFPSIGLVFSTIDDSSVKPKIVRFLGSDLTTPGGEVEIGNEKFYVIGQDNGNVKLLAMYNLHVGNTIDEENNITPLTHPTGIQDCDARGYVAGEYPFIGTTEFSYTSTSYSGSKVEGYVNSYKTYLINMGVDISSARLITKKELETLGCDSSNKSCSGAPNWVYSTSYWSETANDNSYIWIVSSGGHFGINYNYAPDIAVRPLIEIPLSEFE